MDLDQLRRDLRAEATVIPPADLVTARHGVRAHVRRHRLRRGLAVAVVAGLILVVGAALVGRHGQSAQRVVTNTGSVPYLIPGFMSDQMRFANVADLPASGGDLPAERIWIYATGHGGDPLAGSSFAVLALEFPTDPSPSGTGVVHGFAGYVPAKTGLRGAAFRVDATTSYEVLSADLSNEQLRTIGQSVRVSADGPLPRLDRVTAPDGYRQAVADASGGSLSAGGEAIDTTARGYVALWNAATPGEDGLRLVFVSVTASTPADLDALRWGLQGVTRVDVNGHPAVLGSLAGGETRSTGGEGATVIPGPRTWILSWILDDGTRVTVQALGGLTTPGCAGDCTPGVVEQIARSLHRVDAAQWRAFTSASTTTSVQPGCVTTSTGGQACTFSGQGTAVGVTTTVTGSR